VSSPEGSSSKPSPRSQQYQLDQLQQAEADMGQGGLPKDLASLYGLSLGTAVCMADLIRQVSMVVMYAW
jgi:hypothetical protein